MNSLLLIGLSFSLVASKALAAVAQVCPVPVTVEEFVVVQKTPVHISAYVCEATAFTFGGTTIPVTEVPTLVETEFKATNTFTVTATRLQNGAYSSNGLPLTINGLYINPEPSEPCDETNTNGVPSNTNLLPSQNEYSRPIFTSVPTDGPSSSTSQTSTNEGFPTTSSLTLSSIAPSEDSSTTSNPISTSIMSSETLSSIYSNTETTLQEQSSGTTSATESPSSTSVCMITATPVPECCMNELPVGCKSLESVNGLDLKPVIPACEKALGPYATEDMLECWEGDITADSRGTYIADCLLYELENCCITELPEGCSQLRDASGSMVPAGAAKCRDALGIFVHGIAIPCLDDENISEETQGQSIIDCLEVAFGFRSGPVLIPDGKLCPRMMGSFM